MARKKKKPKKKFMKKLIVCSLILLFAIFLFKNPFLIIKLNGDNKMSIPVNSKYEESGAVASFFGENITHLEVDSKVDNKKVGKYEVKYKAKKLLTTKTITRIVNVIDNEKPIITFSSDVVNICSNNYDTKDYKATDNLDGNITNKVKVTKDGDYLVYTVNDSSGNETTARRKIDAKDNEKPKLILKGEKIYNIKIGSKYEEPGYIATDNCDGDLNSKVTISGSIDTSKIGIYTLTYTVIDSSNNMATMTREVNVKTEITEDYPLINGYGKDIEGPTYIKGILIVNKIYSLPSDYNPGVNKDAEASLHALQAAALVDGYNMPLISGFRSYDTQKRIYANNVATKGHTYTDYASAREGHSEHQSGLSFDVGKIEVAWGNTDAGKWLASNAHKYGFIIRYEKDKTDKTGYSYEPWHIRYLGVDIATEIYNKGITLEEYLGVKGTYEN